MDETFTFLEYADDEAACMWNGAHKYWLLKMAEKFDGFSDFGTRPITKYKPRQIHDFLDYLTDECDLSNNTANYYAAMIIKVFKQAYKNQDIERVPDFTWKRVKNAHRMSYFTPEQVDQVVEYFRNSKKHNWMAPMVLIAANTGMRVGEILSIGPNTIFDNTKGKPYVHLMYTKNGDGRYVYLNAKARQALRELDDCPKNHYIMYNFYATWKCLRRDVLNGDEKLVFHSLRHTFATRQANEFRLNHTLIPKIMGHRSLVTTSKYVKLMPEVQQSVCDAM
jgi:integrase